MKYKTSSGGTLLIIVIIFAAVALTGVLGFVFWQNFIKDKTVSTSGNVTNFAQCKEQDGSKLLLTYPEQCVTTDGKTFIGPSDMQPVQKMTSYCAPAEKLCFDYPEDWKITQVPRLDTVDGFNGDSLTLSDPSGIIHLHFISAIDGLGGVCGPDGETTYVLGATAIPTLTGFKTEFEGSSDQLYATKMVTKSGDNKYAAYVYVTGTTNYTKKQEITDIAGVCFSNFIYGRHANLGYSGDSHGAFSFGNTFNLQGESQATLYDTVDQAKAAFESTTYAQAEAVLLSLRYQ